MFLSCSNSKQQKHPLSTQKHLFKQQKHHLTHHPSKHQTPTFTVDRTRKHANNHYKKTNTTQTPASTPF